jgi:hypothetical protein
MGGELNSKLLCWGCWSCSHLCSVGKNPSKLPSIPNALFNHFKLDQKREKKEQIKKRKRKQKKRTSDDLVGYLLCRDIDLSLLSQDVDCLKLT